MNNPGNAIGLAQINWRKQTAAMFLVVLLMLEASTLAALRIEGELEYRITDSTPPQLLSAKRFIALRERGYWQVSTTASKTATDTHKIRSTPHTVVCDGETISILRQFSPEDFPADVRQQMTRMENLVTNRVIITRTTFPIMDIENLTAAVWLPYFSDTTVNWKTVNVLPKVFSMRPVSGNQPHSNVAVEFQENAPSSVKSIEFFSVGKMQYIGEDKLMERPLPERLKNHYVEAVFTVETSTNFHGNSYPVNSRIDYFRVKKDRESGSAFEVFAQVTVKSDKFQITSESIIPPTVELQGRTFVLDERVKSAEGKRVSYVTTNKVFALESVQHKKIRQDFERRQAEIRVSTGKTIDSISSKRIVISAAFISISVAAIITVVRVSKNNKTTKRT